MSKQDNPELIGSKMRGREKSTRPLVAAAALFTAVIALAPQASLADEDGVSFWIPGTFGSLAAVPGEPGWSFATFNYYDNISAGADVAAAREITVRDLNPTLRLNLSASLHAYLDCVFVNPSYAFATPVLGGQLALSMGGFFGHEATGINGTLTAASGSSTRAVSQSFGDSVTGVGNLYPQASLKWNEGFHNFMIYGMGDIPVGTYSSTSLANLGIGHGAADAGAGYTYFDPAMGHEFSAVAGFTYNLTNTATNYQSGVDFHIDWGASQYLSKQFFVGAVGYLYDEIGCDSGSGDSVGCFRSRVIGVGPQAGYLFPVGDMQGYLNLKAYREFDRNARPDGWNVWLTLAISPAAPPPPAATTQLVTK